MPSSIYKGLVSPSPQSLAAGATCRGEGFSGLIELADERCCPGPGQSALLQHYSIYLFMISVGGVLDDLLSQSEIF